MKPEDFKPVALTSLSDATETLHFAMRELERRQVSYNETVAWVATRPDDDASLLLRHLEFASDALGRARFAALTAHGKYISASEPVSFVKD